MLNLNLKGTRLEKRIVVTRYNKTSGRSPPTPDMRSVQNFTPPEFQAKTISPNLVLVIKTQKVSGNGETYTTGKKFTLPLAVTAWTNLTSACLKQVPGSVLVLGNTNTSCMLCLHRSKKLAQPA